MDATGQPAHSPEPGETTRRGFLRTGMLGTGAMLSGASQGSANADRRRPNFLFLICDQLGLDALSGSPPQSRAGPAVVCSLEVDLLHDFQERLHDEQVDLLVFRRSDLLSDQQKQWAVAVEQHRGPKRLRSTLLLGDHCAGQRLPLG